MKKSAENYVNYQERALEFKPGDMVSPFGYLNSAAGRVVRVYPAIGMVDVEFPSGSKRYPVEDIQRFNEYGGSEPPYTDSIPAGSPSVEVPGGPSLPVREIVARHVRNALYWSGPGRRYRATRSEIEHNAYCCPKCGHDPIQKTVYKRFEGKSERLLGCPSCLFLIKPCDIDNDCEEG
jgi:hypothetical protein